MLLNLQNIFINTLFTVVFVIGCGFISFFPLSFAWRSSYFCQFNKWRILLISNLLFSYKHDNLGNLTRVQSNRKSVVIPKFLNHVLNPADFIIKSVKRRGYFKQNYPFLHFWEKEIPGIFSNYTLWCYNCVFRQDKNLFFYIFEVVHKKTALFYLAFPPQTQLKVLERIGVNLPIYYASKFPISSKIMARFINFSDSIMSFENQQIPNCFDFFNFMLFKNRSNEDIKQLENEIRRVFNVSSFKNIKGFEKFQSLFEPFIVKKSKSSLGLFENSVKFENDNYLLLKLLLKNRADRAILHWMMRSYDMTIIAFQNIQSYKILKFIDFIDWFKLNFHLLDKEDIRQIRFELMDLRRLFSNLLIAELDFYQITPKVLKRDDIEEYGPAFRYLKVQKMAIYFLDTCIWKINNYVMFKSLISPEINQKSLGLQFDSVSMPERYSYLFTSSWITIENEFNSLVWNQNKKKIKRLLKYLIDYKRKVENSGYWKKTSLFKKEFEFRDDLFAYLLEEGRFPEGISVEDELTRGKSDIFILIEEILLELKIFKEKIDFNDIIEKYKFQVKQLIIDREIKIGFLIIMDTSPQKLESTQSKLNEIRPILIKGGRNIKAEDDQHPIGIICILINGGVPSKRSDLQK